MFQITYVCMYFYVVGFLLNYFIWILMENILDFHTYKICEHKYSTKCSIFFAWGRTNDVDVDAIDMCFWYYYVGFQHVF